MNKRFFLVIALIITIALCLGASDETKQPRTEIIKTDAGPLTVTFLGHGTLRFDFNKMVIHIDPFSRVTDYTKQPKADLVLITHHHGDHLDENALAKINAPKTRIMMTQKCAEKFTRGAETMANGDTRTINGIKVEAVPAYNIQHKRKDGSPFHMKGEGNGYVITFGNKRVYVAGDTENVPEMKALKNIEAAFLPMNLPFTMTEEMVADAAKAFKPRILFIYHFFPQKADFEKLKKLLRDTSDIDLRI